MFNLIKVLLVVAVAAFSSNASAYAYKGYNEHDDHRVIVIKVSKRDWARKSYKCGWLCKGDKPKFSSASYEGDYSDDDRSDGDYSDGDHSADKHKIKNKVKKLKKKLKKLKLHYAGVDHQKPPYDIPECKTDYQCDEPDHDVPEPAMAGLLAIGLLGIAVRRRMKV